MARLKNRDDLSMGINFLSIHINIRNVSLDSRDYQRGSAHTLTHIARITITSNVHVRYRFNDLFYICSTNIAAISSWRGFIIISHTFVSRLARCSAAASIPTAADSRDTSRADPPELTGQPDFRRDTGTGGDRVGGGEEDESVHYREDDAYDSMWE